MSWGAQIGGSVDPNRIRETAYGADVRIAYELITGKRDRLLAKSMDKLLGDLDMLYNGQLGAVAPLHGGAGDGDCDSLLRHDGAGGHPDYRVPPAVKRALDGLWRDYYVPALTAFATPAGIFPPSRTGSC